MFSQHSDFFKIAFRGLYQTCIMFRQRCSSSDITSVVAGTTPYVVVVSTHSQHRGINATFCSRLCLCWANSTFTEKFCGCVSFCPLVFEYSIRRTLGRIYLNLQAQNMSHALLAVGFHLLYFSEVYRSVNYTGSPAK